MVGCEVSRVTGQVFLVSFAWPPWRRARFAGNRHDGLAETSHGLRGRAASAGYLRRELGSMACRQHGTAYPKGPEPSLQRHG